MGGEVGTAKDADAVPNIVEYDDSGKMIGAQRVTLLTNGFSDCKIVFIPNKDVVHHELSKIISIDLNGDVTIAKCDADGSEQLETATVVVFAEFFKKYRVFAKAVQLHGNWPMSAPINNSEYTNNAFKAHVSIALVDFGMRFHTDDIRVQEKPIKCVFAMAEFNAFTVVFPPCTTFLVMDATRDAKLTPKVVTVNSGTDGPRVILAEVHSKDFCAPFWSLRRVNKKENANCEIIDKYVECAAPKIQGLPRTTSSIHLSIPCAHNFVDVKSGDELVLYQPAPASVAPVKDKKPSLVIDAPATKRHKST